MKQEESLVLTNVTRDGYKILVIAENSTVDIVNIVVTKAIHLAELMQRIEVYQVRSFFQDCDVLRFDYIFITPKIFREINICGGNIYLVHPEAFESLNKPKQKKYVEKIRGLLPAC